MPSRGLLVALFLVACHPAPAATPAAPPSGREAATSSPEVIPPLGPLPANAPPDQIVKVDGEGMISLENALVPYIDRGRQTYPAARERFLRGLPPGHTFFVMTPVVDPRGKETIFVAVDTIRDGKITGRIATEILGRSGLHQGDVYTLAEGDLIDWMISRPDGSEEGNVVGKFLDEWQARRGAGRP